MDSFNADKNPDAEPWGVCEVGWVYTPGSIYNLTGVRTKFGSGDSRVVTVEVYDELPSQGGTLLRSATFSPLANAFAGGSFEPLEVTAGEDYFIGIRNVLGLSANFTPEPDSVSVSPLYYSATDSGSYEDITFYYIFTQAILQFEGFEGQVPDPCGLDPDKSYRGMAFLSSNINNSIPSHEIRNFVSDCNLDFVVIDLAWITYHWPQTDLAAVEQLAAGLADNGVEVAAMYRPRALSPSDADIHYAQNCDGTIDPSHNHLCFAYEDSAAWGAQWGTQILNALPSINKVIIYNLLAPCCCELCQGGQGAFYAEQFMERCRLEWGAVRPGVQIGHVGIGAEYANQVDFFCPFLMINRWGDINPVDVNTLLDDLITPDSQPGNKPVIPLAKICWEDATDNTTEDIVNTVESCENRQTGFILWYYDWIFHNETGRYDAQAITEALGGQWNPTNPPWSWVYFESKESTEGQAPVLALSLDSSDQDIPVNQDTCLISYWPDEAWGMLGQLAISMDDTNRDLLAFSLSGVGPGAILESAELILDMKQSGAPTVAPFDLAVHVATEPWSEYTTTWNNQPAFETDPCVIVSIDPNPGLKVIDITGIVSNWLTEAIPNYGILLTVAEAVPEIPDLTFPYEEPSVEALPWPHQAPDLTPQEIESLNQQIHVVNDFPLYQADEEGWWRYFHGGLDIILDNGTPIYAMKDGWVKVVSIDTVVIADTPGDEPSYGWEYTHLGNFQVQVGDFVTNGTLIGQVNFGGWAHIHLNKVFSEGDYWGQWRYMCMPNGHFSYIDEEPPVIGTPFYFFENNSDTEIGPDGTGNVVLSGQVDIVVPMREQGLYARSNDGGWPGDRLAVTKIEYEICPADSGAGSGHVLQSFDFNDIKIKSGFFDTEYSTELTKVVYKHWTLFEPNRTSWDKVFSYYIITNCSGQQSPQEINISDRNYCWDTTALDANGQPVFPNGIYDIITTAYDFSGHSSAQTMTVEVDNPPSGLLVPDQFPTIQEAINAAVTGDIVSVAPGVYEEEIDFLGKAITVQGTPAAAIVDGVGGCAVSFLSGEGPNSVLKNFVIRNSYMAIFLAGSSPKIRNVTVCDNEYGVAAYAGAQPDISNSIFWNNTQDDLLLCQARYSCIEDGDQGLGNIDHDPCFVDTNNGDCHLRSQAGRWDANSESWVCDGSTSLCIDAGNPGSPLGDEPNDANNLRINMGAYGGTSEAGRTPADWSLPADLTNDGIVDFKDFAAQAGDWQTSRDEQPGDLKRDGIIDIADLAFTAEEWLEETSWAGP
ncbi:MAG: DNRLRE domain-containing protein [Planctomycetota bacterium]